jgi:hypothetical protein
MRRFAVGLGFAVSERQGIACDAAWLRVTWQDLLGVERDQPPIV